MYIVRANEAIHLMPAVKESDEMVKLHLDNLSQVRKFFLEHSEFGKGRRDKNSKSISYTHLAVSRFLLTSILGPVLTSGMS